MAQSVPGVSHPAMAPVDSGEEHELQIEDAVQQGQHTTVVRDEEGDLVYPSYLPPETKSPTSPQAPELAIPPPEQGPKKTSSDPPAVTGEKPRPGRQPGRPSMDKKWRTDVFRGPGRRISALPPAMKRAGTNVSQLQDALWRTQHAGDSSSSDESSSDDDEAPGPATPAGGSVKAQPKKRADDDKFGRFRVANENYRTKGKISKRDGRLNITVKDTSNTGYLAKALGAAVKKVVPLKEGIAEAAERKEVDALKLSAAAIAALDHKPKPRLNIVIMVIGSRGDAQPFLKIGKVLKEEYGHRVRIATHPAFREFVEKDSGLEFFSVGGDPSELMAFMVKNPGMIPTLESVKAGDIGRRRSAMAEMFDGFWRACVNATDDEKDVRNLKMMGEKHPFVADAIIANPPSFAHVHCAEALGIPLHMMFTFPYTPTQAFPHPLASIKRSNVDPGYTNFISYPLVEMMVWQGLGDLVNEFRVRTLGLDPVSTLWAPGATYRLHVPFSYLWSPGLVPKPEDWGEEVDVSGFVFLDLASAFEPPDSLVRFLDSGEPPIYIGFGSIVVDDADKFTEMIFEAVHLSGARALVSKGWGGLGGESTPDNIYMLENTPHDWLFPRVSACVIHGGAGTTAIAMKCGKPTMVVPFFGDQHFWGGMLSRSGAGPEPVPYKSLSAEKLAEGIKYCLSDEARSAAQQIARDVEAEGDGAENAVRAFHQHLNLQGKDSMRCSIFEERVACWTVKKSNLKLSALAADIVVEKGYLPWKKLRLLRHQEWNDFEGPGEPVTGLAGSLAGTAASMFGGVGSVPGRLAKTSQKRKERKERKTEKRMKAKQVAAEKRKLKKEQAEKRKTNGNTLHDEHEDVKDEADKISMHDKAAEGNGVAKVPNGVLKARDQAAGTDQESINESVLTATTTGAEDNPAEEYGEQVAQGVGRSAGALAKAPVDLSVALAQGFHNAPRLYGDDTVRRPTRVTGIQSGLRAAGQEFVFGIYDGWTGVVRLPIRGAKSGGVKGFVKGCGMGLTGFVLKDISAIIGPFGYTLKGLKKQAERGRLPNKVVRRARILQAQRELQALGDDEVGKVRDEVQKRWGVFCELQDTLHADQKKKGLIRHFNQNKQMKTGRGLDAAFENVEIAEKVLAAVKKGEDIEVVLNKQRKSEEAAPKNEAEVEIKRKATDQRASADKGRDIRAKGQTAEQPPPNVAGERQTKIEDRIPEEESGQPDGENVRARTASV